MQTNGQTSCERTEPTTNTTDLDRRTDLFSLALEACLTNDPKDRHVLGAAIGARCEVIVTFSLNCRQMPRPLVSGPNLRRTRRIPTRGQTFCQSLLPTNAQTSCERPQTATKTTNLYRRTDLLSREATLTFRECDKWTDLLSAGDLQSTASRLSVRGFSALAGDSLQGPTRGTGTQ
jgi:hypothetical protein